MAALGTAILAAVLLLALVVTPDARTNLLVMGIDRRPEEGNTVRADAIMVVTANPRKPALGLFSIPRDLYLPIPGQGENRINTAHFFGELEEPGSGPDRTAATIYQNLGIPVDGWVRVDFAGFEALIDAAGGVEIKVSEPIVDYAYPTEDYGTMTIEIPAGTQRMDGEQALQYARTRHSSSDFDRADRQQQVVQALIRQLMQPTSWLRLPAFFTALNQAVDSDLSLLSLFRLGVAAVRVGPEGIDCLVIDQELASPFTTATGAWVLDPHWEQIQPLVNEMFDLR